MSPLCRYIKRRTTWEWAGLFLAYVTLGQLLFSALVYAQATPTYRFGSGSTFGSGTNATDKSAVDVLRQEVSAQGAQIEMMNERSKYNISRLDELTALNVPVKLALLEKAVKDAADNAADLKRLGYQLLAAVVAGLVLQIIHVRSQGKTHGTTVDEIRDVVSELLREAKGER